MVKRILALALAAVLAFTCLLIPAAAQDSHNLRWEALKSQLTKNDKMGDCYVYPYGTTFDATVVKGGSTMLQFQRYRATPRANDVFYVDIYAGGVLDFLESEEEPPLVESRTYQMSQFSAPSYALAMTWTADSRYHVGDYTMVYSVFSANGDWYDQTYYYVELHVVSGSVAMTGMEFWNNTDGELEQLQISQIYVNPNASTMLLVEKQPLNTTNTEPVVASVDKPAIATASIRSGYLIITGGLGGRATITVRCGSVTRMLYVTVGVLNNLSIAGTRTTLCVGDTDTVRLVSDPAGAPVYYEWSSSNPKVATVSNGVVTAVSPGTVDITVSAYNDISRTLRYTVQYHKLPEDTPVTERTATQPKQAVGHCSVCGKDNVANIYEPAIFTDTVATSWYAPHVDKVYDLGLMNGTGEHTFAPNANVNRAMAATVLWRIAGEPEVDSQSEFTDIPLGKYYTKAVLWAENIGVVNGYPDGTFRPNDNITREQLAAILYRYASAEGKVREADVNLDSFPDAANVHNYAKDAMAWAVGAELINGVGSGGKSYLQPANNATRAQFATIISRYMESVDPIEPEPEPPAYHSAESTDALIAWIKAETAAPTEDAQTFKTFLDAANEAKNLLLVQSAAEEYALEQILVLSGHTYLDYFFGKDDRFEVVVEATGETLAERITQVNAELAEEYEDRQFTKSTGKVNGADAEIYFCDGGEYAKKDSEEKEKLAPTAFFECQGSLVCIRGLDSLYDAKWDNAWLELFTFERKDLTETT